MHSLFLENEVLRVGILLDKGADLFQFLHKPTDTDFLWRSPNGLANPARFNASSASSSGTFLDNYHGGWQEILPGGGPALYRGAELGLHGEVTQLGWDCEILDDRPECISVRLSVSCVRTPFRLVRTMRLEAGKAVLFIDETLTNRSPESQQFIWGHHPAFGSPFLRAGLRLFVPARRVEVQDPQFMSSSLLEPGAEFDWPLAAVGDQTRDLSVVSGPEAGFGELVYLKDLDSGWYALLDPERRLGFGLAWPLEVFPYLWFWQVYGKAPGYPWWDQVYVLALEPFSGIPNSLEKATNRGAVTKIEGGESLSISICAVVLEDVAQVEVIRSDGSYQ
jgi:galactose mutarotase-like enzyme